MAEAQERSAERYGIALTPERSLDIHTTPGYGVTLLLWAALFVWLVNTFIVLNSSPFYHLGAVMGDPANFFKWKFGQQVMFLVMPFWLFAPVAVLVFVVRWDIRVNELAVLRESRVLLSAFDRQSPLLWTIGVVLLLPLYVPMYAIKRRRLAGIAAFTIDRACLLQPEDAATIQGKQRWIVIGTWALLCGCPGSTLVALLFVLEGLARWAA